MISRSEIEKLLGIQAPEPSVLSLYLSVPKDPAALRGLPARADELFALAARPGAGGPGAGGPGPGAGGPGAGSPSAGSPSAVRVLADDRQQVRRLLEWHARDWLGHTVAIFSCARLRLSEAVPLPCALPERAVLATRPHVRPLLVALQRCPAYWVAVIDQRHAWLLRVTGERIETAARSDVTASAAESVRSPGFGGWYGLESYRINERMVQLARHHFHDTATVLEQATRAEGRQPLVVGGHEQTIPQFVAALPAALAERIAGSFIADPHTLTPARVRALAGPVIQNWVNLREQDLVRQLWLEPPGPLLAMGLQPCLAAVNQHAGALLVVPVGGLVPGFACSACGRLSSASGDCPDGPGAWHAVPDLIEEMAVKTLGDGGQVEAVRDPPCEIAARLRFPLTGSN